MTFLQYFSKRFDICSSLLIELCIKKETGFVAQSPLIVYPQPIVLSRVSCLNCHLSIVNCQLSPNHPPSRRMFLIRCN